MSPVGSVTHWIEQLKAGNAEVVQPLWERYFTRLVELVRSRLAGAPRGPADEEDVALSAFNSFYRGATAGRFPRLNDRTDLWKLLMVIAARKAADLVNHEGRLKRGGEGGVNPRLDAEISWEDVVGREPTPQFAAQVAEDYRRLLDRLDDALLRDVAVWKMEGYTTEEVAAKLGCAPRTVERKLALIRAIWSDT